VNEELCRRIRERDPELKLTMKTAKERLEVAQQVYWLRSHLSMSEKKFAELLGWAPEKVHSVEHGDFTENAFELFMCVDTKVREFKKQEENNGT